MFVYSLNMGFKDELIITKKGFAFRYASFGYVAEMTGIFFLTDISEKIFCSVVFEKEAMMSEQFNVAIRFACESVVIPFFFVSISISQNLRLLFAANQQPS